MTRDEYTAALDALELGHHALATARVLGCKLRTIQNYAQGVRPVPDTVALLLAMYQKHGVPKRWLR
jgi:hypothetical protein